MVVGFEMYQGVGKDDVIAKLQGSTGFQMCVLIPFSNESSELGPFTQSLCPLNPVALFEITN